MFLPLPLPLPLPFPFDTDFFFTCFFELPFFFEFPFFDPEESKSSSFLLTDFDSEFSSEDIFEFEFLLDLEAELYCPIFMMSDFISMNSLFMSSSILFPLDFFLDLDLEPALSPVGLFDLEDAPAF
mgnify:CR=1 FL=1